MNNFPEFMKRSANIVPRTQQNTQKIEGYYYTANDGSQMAFWTYHADRTSKKHTHPFDEYMICVDGHVIVYINGEPHKLSKGDELVIPSEVEHYEKVTKGTRTIYAFGGKRIE
ncbi:MAG: cupin domain-containing protein [Clostridiales bacterium]|jgi:quercetin dioxygenase-like cupin family protein|nr:cupin domain-containing protein [Clostridiales bacterium]